MNNAAKVWLVGPIILMAIFLIQSLSFAESEAQAKFLRNPFVTLEEQELGYQPVKAKPKELAKALELQGVFIRPGKKIAIINGVVLREGEVIHSRKVVSILSEKVILTDNAGERVTLYLSPVFQATQKKDLNNE